MKKQKMKTMAKTSALDGKVNKLFKNQTFRYLITLYGLITLLGIVLGALLKV